MSYTVVCFVPPPLCDDVVRVVKQTPSSENDVHKKQRNLPNAVKDLQRKVHVLFRSFVSSTSSYYQHAVQSREKTQLRDRCGLELSCARLSVADYHMYSTNAYY